jgi:CubicO group peptidase (beta-lactamase class C family)
MAIEHRALFALSIAFTASVVAYPALPPDIPPRAGHEGAFIGAPFVAFLLPVTATVIWWLFAQLDRRGPGSAPRVPKAGAATALFLSAFHVITLIGLTGGHPWFGRILGFIVGVFLTATGNELPRLRPKVTVGSRGRQTLEAEHLWRVHRLGGHIRVLMGLSVCVASLAGMRGFAGLIVLGVALEAIVHVGGGIRSSRRKTAAVTVLLMCSAGAATRAGAQVMPREKIEALPAFIDTTIPRLMEQRHVTGTAVVVVHDGRVVLSRGYGKARLNPDARVDPSRTLFRIGSVTKVFTAAAAVQLAEAGRLDLHRDVRQYLPDIPLRYGTTAHQLLTHTAGFDERLAGAYTDSPRSLQRLSEHLQGYLPEQLFRPGTASSYSNYNYALAGLVVERLSGLPYEQYVADKLFRPLRMTSTTARQPPEPDLAVDLAQGYEWDGHRHEGLPFTYTQAAPAGAVTTTAADMGHFMLAMLGDGSVHGERILSPASVRMMLEPQYIPHPRAPGWTYGFSPMLARAHRLVVRGGTLGDQAALMVLVPGARLGVFVVSNAVPGIGDFLFEPMLTQLAGPAVLPPPPTPLPDAPQRARRFAGTYRTIRQVRREMSRLRTLMPMSQSRLVADADGAIRWHGRRWVEVEPLLFRAAEGEDHLLFRQDERGEITGVGEYQRIEWWEQPPFHVGVLASCLAAFLACLLYGGVRLVRRRPTSPEGRTARLCAVLVAGVNLIFLAGLGISIRELGTITPLPWSTLLLLSLPLASLALTALLPGFAATAWWERWWTRRERLGYSTFAFLAVAFMTFLNYWRLLGVQY